MTREAERPRLAGGRVVRGHGTRRRRRGTAPPPRRSTAMSMMLRRAAATWPPVPDDRPPSSYRPAAARSPEGGAGRSRRRRARTRRPGRACTMWTLMSTPPGHDKPYTDTAPEMPAAPPARRPAAPAAATTAAAAAAASGAGAAACFSSSSCSPSSSPRPPAWPPRPAGDRSAAAQDGGRAAAQRRPPRRRRLLPPRRPPPKPSPSASPSPTPERRSDLLGHGGRRHHGRLRRQRCGRQHGQQPLQEHRADVREERLRLREPGEPAHDRRRPAGLEGRRHQGQPGPRAGDGQERHQRRHHGQQPRRRHGRQRPARQHQVLQAERHHRRRRRQGPQAGPGGRGAQDQGRRQGRLPRLLRRAAGGLSGDVDEPRHVAGPRRPRRRQGGDQGGQEEGRLRHRRLALELRVQARARATSRRARARPRSTPAPTSSSPTTRTCSTASRRYHGGLIFYSLGNLVFSGFSGETAETILVRAKVSEDGIDAQLVPVVGGGSGVPSLATGSRGRQHPPARSRASRRRSTRRSRSPAARGTCTSSADGRSGCARRPGAADDPDPGGS